MKMGKWARLLLLAAPILAGCGDFWEAPGGNTSFTLTNSGNISVSPGATSSNTSTITVTPSSSFTGTVALSCTVSGPSGATSATTCSLSPASVTISSTTAETSTLTATTTSSTTLGAYEITVTGTSGSVAETTSVCAEVTTSSSSCSSASGTSGVFYVLDNTTDQIVALSISSGKLNTIGSWTVPSASPTAIAVAPNGQFLYVSTTYGIYLYTIGSNGALTIGNSGGTISADQAITMQVDATNSWLVDAVSATNQLWAIAINPSTGALAVAGEKEVPFTLPASTPIQLAISPNDSSSCTACYVFVAMGNGGTEIIHFNPYPSSGNPFGSFGNPGLVNSSSGDNAVAVDPTNRLVYVGESDSRSGAQTGGLRVFTIASGGVSELNGAGSPYAIGGTGPSAILPSADGNYVYVANKTVSGSSTGNIASFSVSTTSLTSIGTVSAGPSGSLGMAEDSSGSFLLAVDFAGNPDLQAYTMKSGTLTSVLTVSTGNDPAGAIAIAAAP